MRESVRVAIKWLGLVWGLTLFVVLIFTLSLWSKVKSQSSDGAEKVDLKNLPQMIYLLEQPAPPLDLCGLPCEDIPPAIVRLNQYVQGDFTIGVLVPADRAFALAQLVQRAHLGPEGRRLFGILHRLKEKPFQWRSLEIIPLLPKLADLQTKLMKRAKVKSLEAGVLLQRLVEAGATCPRKTWVGECRLLQKDIDAWVSAGALGD